MLSLLFKEAPENKIIKIKECGLHRGEVSASSGTRLPLLRQD